MKVAELRDELFSVYGHKSDEINNIKTNIIKCNILM